MPEGLRAAVATWYNKGWNKWWFFLSSCVGLSRRNQVEYAGPALCLSPFKECAVLSFLHVLKLCLVLSLCAAGCAPGIEQRVPAPLVSSPAIAPKRQATPRPTPPAKAVHPFHRVILAMAAPLPPHTRHALRGELARSACAAGQLEQGRALLAAWPQEVCLSMYAEARLRRASDQLDTRVWSLNPRARLAQRLQVEDTLSPTERATWRASIRRTLEAVEDLDQRIALGVFVLAESRADDALDRAWIGHLTTWIEQVPYASLRAVWMFRLAEAIDAHRGPRMLQALPADALLSKKTPTSLPEARVLLHHAQAHAQWERAWKWARRCDALNEGVDAPEQFPRLLQQLLATQRGEDLLAWADRQSPGEMPLSFYTAVAVKALAQGEDDVAKRAEGAASGAFPEDEDQLEPSVPWMHHRAQLLQARGKVAQAKAQWNTGLKVLRRDDIESKTELDRVLKFGPKMIEALWGHGHQRLALRALDVLLHVADHRARPFDLTTLPDAMDSKVWSRAVQYGLAQGFVEGLSRARIEQLHKRVLSDVWVLKAHTSLKLTDLIVRACATSACKQRGLRALSQQIQSPKRVAQGVSDAALVGMMGVTSWGLGMPQLVAWIEQQPAPVRSRLWLSVLQHAPVQQLSTSLLRDVFRDASTHKQHPGARRSMRRAVALLVDKNQCDVAWSVQRAQVEPLRLDGLNLDACTHPAHVEAKLLLISQLDVSLEQRLRLYVRHAGHLPNLNWAQTLSQLKALEHDAPQASP